MFLLCVLQGLCEGHHSFWRGSFELRSPNTNATNAGLNIDLIYLFIRHYKKFKKTEKILRSGAVRSGQPIVSL